MVKCCATGTFIVYSLGFPVYLFRTFRRNRDAIVEDLLVGAYESTRKDLPWKRSPTAERMQSR